ncbi:MAG: 3-dehydroquinate synthase [Hyphomonadaceae bacterium]
MTHTITIPLGARSYDVLIGAGLLARAGELIAPFARAQRVFIVTDQNVARLHRAALASALDAAGLKNWTITLPPGEGTKSFETLELLTRHLLQAGVTRSDLVVAFGGGVIGDIAGLAAGLVLRGVDFVQIPTTLLAQVDSSVGGKTAIDAPEGKNLIGLIYQPRLVLADLDVLATLPAREMRCGYAEIVKYGLIDMPDFYAWCRDNAAKVIAAEPQALAHAVRTSVEAKTRIVAADEREQGARALLNLGHTFAHALEAHAGFDGALAHGEAVAAGIGLAFALSAKLGLCDPRDAHAVREHFAVLGFETDLRALPGAPYNADQLVQLMAADKKAEAGGLTLILARAPGQAFIQKRADAEAVRALLIEETQ